MGNPITGGPDELLLRQVTPSCLTDEGEPSSQAFFPWRDIDEGCLSVDQHKLTTASESFVLFTTPRPTGFGLDSEGVWGLSLAEIHAQALTARQDALDATKETPANPAHAVVEFGTEQKKKWRSIGRTLKVRALQRGRLHPQAA